MKYLITYKLFESSDISEIETYIADILLDVNDEGIDTKIEYHGYYEIEISLDRINGKELSRDDLILWKDIKDVVMRITSYINGIGGYEIKYYMDSFILLFDDNTLKYGKIYPGSKKKFGEPIQPDHSCWRFEMNISKKN